MGMKRTKRRSRRNEMADECVRPSLCAAKRTAASKVPT
jgi:hypothetical protein